MKLIQVIVNKWWECDPIISVLLNPNAWPSPAHSRHIVRHNNPETQSVRAINLDQPWQSIHADLLALVA